MINYRIHSHLERLSKLSTLLITVNMAAQLSLVKKTNTKSPVWNHFSLRADDKGLPIAGDEDKPVYQKCLKQYQLQILRKF